MLQREIEHCTLAGARKLAYRLAHYWATRGYVFQCRIASMGRPSAAEGNRLVYGIEWSNMRNGWPTERVA